MRPSTVAQLDPRARAEPEAERDRHIHVMETLTAADSDQLVGECERHLRAVEEILRAFTLRQSARAAL